MPFMDRVGHINEVLKIPATLAAVGSTGLLIKMNSDAVRTGTHTEKSNSRAVNITALPGSTVVLPQPGAHMNKVAEAACENAGFSAELSKLTGTAGNPVPNTASDVEQRRAELNGRQGLLGQAGVSHATAMSVAVNQPTPTV